MNTAAFLRNIRQRPHEDAPRLIFADWLEEQGDPRGAFIRLQCLQAGFKINDERKWQLVEQEQALLKRHRDRWVGPLVQRGIGWEFWRGLLRLRVDARTFLRTDWEELTRTETWEWVERTAIRFATPSDIRAVAGSSSLALLESLDLSWNDLGDVGVAALAASPHVAGVRWLDLTFSEIGPEGAARLATSPHLADLTTLKLEDNRLGDRGAESLASARQLPQLVSLHLRWNDIGPAGAAGLGAAQNFPRLAILHLGNNDIGDAGAGALAASTNLPQLAELYLEYNDIGAAAAAALRRRFGDGVHL